MGIFEIIVIGFGLSADAFAVSVCLGLQSVKLKGIKKFLFPAVYFGFFQAAMPVVGYFAGVKFQKSIANYDHWIAFILLFLIGANMIREANSADSKGDETLTDENCTSLPDFSCRKMTALAVATSIDALAVGVTFAFLKANILSSSLLIGLITFLLSIIGVQIGTLFGGKYKKKAEISGGVILILIGIKILIF